MTRTPASTQGAWSLGNRGRDILAAKRVGKSYDLNASLSFNRRGNWSLAATTKQGMYLRLRGEADYDIERPFYRTQTRIIMIPMELSIVFTVSPLLE